MNENVKIIGYYRRESDGNEYIYYSDDGIENITNGVCNWNNINDKGKIQRYIKKLEEVSRIDLVKMKCNLSKFFPHSNITKILN